ncbi:MAG: UDP-N-acetylmuramoyl-L-alanyl-D-glutamate--2,6-diaminopimelate ligase [Magnetococcales bacterium]|nr:UDP-N-acetylmuramoyl-L-alanyl-D-glutamate--2,6-diaminopimelate ligase [Magnetococcales bacterium]
MKLSRLLAQTRLEGVRLVGADVEISAVTADSRLVGPGALFAALSGSRAQGAQFIDPALAAGAVAILHDGSREIPATGVIHPQPRRALAALAAAFYDHPTDGLPCVGITGSNGKTTVAAMVEAILGASGMASGVIGTTGSRHGGGTRPATLTTPDPVTLQQTLHEMRAHGCAAVVAEVSSHALTQQRTAGIPWSAVAFTNLSRDHLDYHGTMEAYWQAKRSLFLDPPHPGAAIINLDDPKGRELVQACEHRGIPVSGFSLEGAPEARFTAKDIRLEWTRTCFHMTTPQAPLDLVVESSGRFNVANALTAAALCWSLGVRESGIAAGLSAFRPVRGRLEPIRHGQPFTVIVDFAHTPDALERLLTTAAEISPQARRLLVFGCGGERDAGKRPIMGEIAGRLASFTVVTDDNPRSEDPASIRQEILRGLETAGGPFDTIPARDRAIGAAISMARPGDVVLIAGKGHETGQITATGIIPFDDAQTARDHLARLGFQGSP